MSFHLLEAPPAWPAPLGLIAHLVAGFAFGLLYFHSLWWTVRRLTRGGRVVATVLLGIGRFAALGGLLLLAALEGVWPLLATTLGLLISRVVTVRRIGRTAR